MKLSFRAARALLVLAAAAAPAGAAAQDAEAWVLPRGLLELSAGGIFSHYDSRLGFGDLPLGYEFVEPLSIATQRSTGPATALVRAGLADFFASTADPQPGPLPDSLTPGRLALRLTGDERMVPFVVRYGLTRRLTLSLTVPIERRGTSAGGPYLAGGTLGINPNPARNGTVLTGVDGRFGTLGTGLLLPVRGTPEAVELQDRLRARSAADTLLLPGTPLTVADLLGNPFAAGLLSPEEQAALSLVSARRPYQLGDVQLGARFLLKPGPAGWPFPDSVTGRALRTSVGARVRLPTGRSGTRFLTELPPGGGHLGVGVDVLNDVFLSSRWYVNASASLDVLFPTDVQRLAFSPTRPFPADSALRTVRRAPGPRLAVTVAPRWRLTDEISFSGEYALLAQQRVDYTGGDEGLRQTPLEWRTGGSLHAVGVGARYSSLQAFARGRADVPFEVTLSLSRAVAGGGAAPQASSIRVTGRIFVDPRQFTRLLPGEPPPADTATPPAAPPADARPSQPRPVVPPQPDTTAAEPAEPRVVPPTPPAAPSADQPSQREGGRRAAFLPRRRTPALSTR